MLGALFASLFWVIRTQPTEHDRFMVYARRKWESQ